jgi:2'-5' RNA ligase
MRCASACCADDVHTSRFARAVALGRKQTSAHITLCVLHLGDEDAVAAAAAALATVSAPALRPRLAGLSTFRSKVLYLQLQPDDGDTLRVCELATAVRAALSAANVAVDAESKDFTPHLTLAKLSNARKGNKRRHCPRTIPDAAFAAAASVDAGRVLCSELLLCSMLARKAPDGFYAVASRVALTAVD